jgi:thiol-disulfide isomerase/thioredoxin
MKIYNLIMIIRKFVSFFLLVSFFLIVGYGNAQNVWTVKLLRPDGHAIVFNFELTQLNKKPVLYLINGADKFLVDNVVFKNDSVFIQMPVFESQFKARIVSPTEWQGLWKKGTSGAPVILPFEAKVQSQKFAVTQTPVANLSGRWQVTFIRPNGTPRPAIAEFVQHNNTITGTFLTPSGDYRYLSGIVNGDTLKLSTFDGGHAYLFEAVVQQDSLLKNGFFYSDATGLEKFSAFKNQNAQLPDSIAATYMKPGETTLHFTFPNLNHQPISFPNANLKNKVVILQIMGSWCPNCMDETQFLSKFYQQYKNKGVEVMALAYELSTDFNRSKASLEKFKQRFNVQYPILITGVAVNDSSKTEKTLPQLQAIKVFPTLIFIGKDGKVAKIDAGFYGPGAGEHYKKFQEEFYQTVQYLLQQKNNNE